MSVQLDATDNDVFPLRKLPPGRLAIIVECLPSSCIGDVVIVPTQKTDMAISIQDGGYYNTSDDQTLARILQPGERLVIK